MMSCPPRRSPPPPLPAALLAAYARAVYTVSGPDGPCVLRVGDATPPLGPVVGRDCRRLVVVTAFNPFSQPVPEAQNRLRARDLALRVADCGLHCVAASGTDPDSAWAAEPGLAVVDADDTMVDRWLVEFEQHAVVVADAGRAVALRLHPGHRRP